MKAFRSLPIRECGEPLVPVASGAVSLVEPHPYRSLGAPYLGADPWRLRSGVATALQQAAALLAARQSNWRLRLFDALRPNRVQAFMVWREFQRQAGAAGLSLAACGNPDQVAQRLPAVYELLAPRVFEFWSEPSEDPASPPLHSTGGAVDLTLVDAAGQEADMGCPIDEVGPRAYPDHFVQASAARLQACHERRRLLNEVMSAAGFSRHPNEWWHFSLGDQLWAWQRGMPAAIYGRME